MCWFNVTKFRRKIIQLELVDCPKHGEPINLRFCLGCCWEEGYYEATKFIDCSYNEEDHT